MYVVGILEDERMTRYWHNIQHIKIVLKFGMMNWFVSCKFCLVLYIARMMSGLFFIHFIIIIIVIIIIIIIIIIRLRNVIRYSKVLCIMVR